jgi:hypothetical protein
MPPIHTVTPEGELAELLLNKVPVFTEEHKALLDQVFPEVGQLTHLSVDRSTLGISGFGIVDGRPCRVWTQGWRGREAGFEYMQEDSALGALEPLGADPTPASSDLLGWLRSPVTATAPRWGVLLLLASLGFMFVMRVLR